MSKAHTPREAAQIRLSYPPGTRIELELMVDAYRRFRQRTMQ